MSKLKILELFGGIGACSKALEKLGIDYEIVDYVEIDKYAVKSFNAIHNTNFEPQDVCKWNKDVEVDLIMHGSPCQDFSLAGLQAGGDEGSGTRSSLMYETIRIVEKLKPKYVIWENVKNVISKKHKHNYDNYCNKMSELGYTNYGQVLNAKDYGIPQNRERVFTISIRKDLNQTFQFPPKQELKLRLKDMLEENVDEKYFLSDKMIEFFKYNEEKQKEKGNGFRFNVSNGDAIAKTITTKAGCRMDDNFITCLLKNKGKELSKTTDVANTLLARDYKGFGNQEMNAVIQIKNATKKGYLETEEDDSINLQRPTSTTRRGRVGKEVAQTLDTQCEQGIVDHNLKIRKLTPKECWKLMGFDDEDFEKAEKVNSNTQLYKQAGNSIVVNVLEAILKELLCNTQ